MHHTTKTVIIQLQINAATYANIARTDRVRYKLAMNARRYMLAREALADWNLSSALAWKYARDARALLREWVGE